MTGTAEARLTQLETRVEELIERITLVEARLAALIPPLQTESATYGGPRKVDAVRRTG